MFLKWFLELEASLLMISWSEESFEELFSNNRGELIFIEF